MPTMLVIDTPYNRVLRAPDVSEEKKQELGERWVRFYFDERRGLLYQLSLHP